MCTGPQDGNGSGLNRVECLDTQNQNPNLKPEPNSKIDSGQNPSPKTETADTRNPIRYLKPVLYCSIVREISISYKYIQDIYNNYMYKQEAINSK